MGNSLLMEKKKILFNIKHDQNLQHKSCSFPGEVKVLV